MRQVRIGTGAILHPLAGYLLHRGLQTLTLIEHPASLTHALVDDAAKEVAHISPGLVRISVGIEDFEDLWADLDAALNLALGVDGPFRNLA